MTLLVTGEYHEIEEQAAAPASPPTGRIRLYCTGGSFEAKDSAGVDYPIVSSLGKIGDVSIEAPTNNQALVWNATTSKWEAGAAGDPNFKGQNTAPTVTATGTDSIAGGPGAAATGLHSVAFGTDAKAKDSRSISIGDKANYAVGGGNYSIAIGYRSNVVTPEAVAIGRFAEAYGAEPAAAPYASIAVGARAKAHGKSPVAIGYGSSAGSGSYGGDYAVTVGSLASGYEKSTVVGGRAYGSIATGGGVCAFGYRTAAYALKTVAIGYKATAGYYGLTGYDIAIGFQAKAQKNFSTALGFNAKTVSVGESVFSTGEFATGSHSAVESQFVCRGETTDATPKLLSPINDGLNKISIPAGSVMNFTIDVAAFENATGDMAALRLHGAIKTVNGAPSVTSLVGAVTQEWRNEDTGATAWAVAVTADDTNKMLQIQVTGEAAKTIRWVAHVKGTVTAF